MKPEKKCTENPTWPLHRIFEGLDWKLSGGTKHCGILAAAMICAYDIDAVIEIGIWNGFTTAILGRALACNAMEKGFLLSIDINSRACKRSEDITKGLPIEHVVVCANTKNFNLAEHMGDRKIGLGFVDGDHTYQHAMHDMKMCDPFMESNAIMIVHDYSKNANHIGVVNAVDEFVSENGWQMFFLPENRKTTDYRTVILQKDWQYK